MYRFVLCVLLIQFATHGQTAEEQVSFSVASVKPVSFTRSTRRETDTGVRYSAVPVMYLVLRAYNIEYYQLVNSNRLGGPTDVYDVFANLPEKASKSQIPAMLRHLLAERFHLSAHWEDRIRPVYTLTVDTGGIKLQTTSMSTEPDENGRPALHLMASPQTGLLHLDGPTTLATLTARLSSNMDRPVMDKTGITDTFEIYLDARVPVTTTISLPAGLPVLQGQPAAAAPTGELHASELRLPDGKVVRSDVPPISSALRKLGLRLEPSREPVKSLVIDSIDKKPTEN